MRVLCLDWENQEGISDSGCYQILELYLADSAFLAGLAELSAGSPLGI